MNIPALRYTSSENFSLACAHRRTAITHMDVGYEDNAGAVIFPWLHATYRPSMDIKKPV